MNTKDREALLKEKRAICREHMEKIQTVIVIPRPAKNTADVLFIFGTDVELFDFGNHFSLPGWIPPKDKDSWGYFKKGEKESWKRFMGKVFKFLTGANEKREILVMKETDFLKR